MRSFILSQWRDQMSFHSVGMHIAQCIITMSRGRGVELELE